MRIIAGQFRGRRLVAPRGMETRPTTDRVREAWFSILGHPGALVVDLFAGTGALGFEALSRGAERAIFVEKSRAAAEAIRANAKTLGVEQRITLLELDVSKVGRALERQGPIDLIMADPPWTALGPAERALAAALNPKFLSAAGVVVLGHPKGRPLILQEISGLELDSTRVWGDSAATFFHRAEGWTG
jgi:16S rRNA (guanine966-N2)-methyltransferase